MYRNQSSILKPHLVITRPHRLSMRIINDWHSSVEIITLRFPRTQQITPFSSFKAFCLAIVSKFHRFRAHSIRENYFFHAPRFESLTLIDYVNSFTTLSIKRSNFFSNEFLLGKNVFRMFHSPNLR